MSKIYKKYDEEFKKTLVALHESGKNYLNQNENMALMNYQLEHG